MISLKGILISSFSIIAALIGAGFASGEEILCYFVVFGRYGILGIISSVLFFGVFIFCVLSFLVKRPQMDYDGFLSTLRGRYTKRIINGVTIFFAISVYGAMLSALAEILKDFVPLPTALTGLILTFLFSLLLMTGVERILSMNGIIGMGLVFFMVLSCLYILTFREYHAFSHIGVNAVSDGFIYSGYNLISMAPLLVCLSHNLKTKSDAVAVTMVTSTTTLILMVLVYALLSIYHNRIDLSALPMLTLARRQNDTLAIIYTSVLSVAVVTTLLSSGSSAIWGLRIENKRLYILLMSMVAYLLSRLGFQNLINIAYRISGIAGIFVCFAILFGMFRAKKIHLL